MSETCIVKIEKCTQVLLQLRDSGQIEKLIDVVSNA